MWSIRHDIDSTMNKEGKVKKRPLEVLGKCWRGFSSTPKAPLACPAATPDTSLAFVQIAKYVCTT